MKYTAVSLLSIIGVCALAFVGTGAYFSFFSSQSAAIASAQTTTGFTFKQSAITVQEGNVARLTVVAPQNISQTTRVSIRVQSGTAKSGTDFRTPTATTVTFYKGGLREKSISISTFKDSRTEQSENFSVRLGTSGPQATVTIQEKSTTTAQGSPVTCPSPYVYLGTSDIDGGTSGKTYPHTLISRPFSYIPWSPTTPYGGGVSFPGMLGSSYGSLRTVDPAVVKLGTIESYEFTMLPETWDGQAHTRALYQKSIRQADGTYAVTDGGLLHDGYFNLAPSPTSSPIPGSSLDQSPSLACFKAIPMISIDECPGVIDARRNVKIGSKNVVGQDRTRGCMTSGEGRLDWTPQGSKYFRARSGDDVGNEESCALVPGKKYYFNLTQVYAVPPGEEGYVDTQGQEVSCGLRLVPRTYISTQ